MLDNNQIMEETDQLRYKYAYIDRIHMLKLTTFFTSKHRNQNGEKRQACV